MFNTKGEILFGLKLVMVHSCMPTIYKMVGLNRVEFNNLLDAGLTTL
jgi:hypothetical protein